MERTLLLKKTSEVGDHLLVNPDHNINNNNNKAPVQTSKQKMLEALYIRKFKPTLNSQI